MLSNTSFVKNFIEVNKLRLHKNVYCLCDKVEVVGNWVE